MAGETLALGDVVTVHIDRSAYPGLASMLYRVSDYTVTGWTYDSVRGDRATMRKVGA
jgi:hypothetical protein